MNYEQTIDYLYSQLPMFTHIGAAAYKEDLHNTIALCNAIGNPQNQIACIHVAGTNGKGSTSHMLAAVLQKAGYKTGLYTSPHIKDFGERIRINGQMIDRSFVIEFTERTKEICKAIEPSFFELTVAMAFEYFAKEKVDIAIIETGLGGRLDSTNIITPILSVITNIGYDHMNLLGNTLPEIALEKAGIIKKNIPVVIGESNDATKHIFIRKAAESNAPILFADEIYQNATTELTNNSIQYTFSNGVAYTLDLKGNYQLKNLRTVLTSLDLLTTFGFKIDHSSKKEALSSVKKITGLSGRWDIVAENPTVIYDVAHNKEGIQEVLLQLKSKFKEEEMHFVLGFVKDKDVREVLKLFPTRSHYYFTNAHIPRAMFHEELKEIAAACNLQGESYDDVNAAIMNGKKKAAFKDVIMVCGSFFILAEIDKNLLAE